MIDPTPLARWVNERHAIYIRKSLREGADPADLHVPPDADLEECDPYHLAALESGPLTHDQALAQYRFCNVFRELDRVTVWVRENIRERFDNHPNLWFMLALARYINWPETLQRLIDSPDAWPASDQFTPQRLGSALDQLKQEQQKLYTGAYMIRAESNPNAEWYSWTKQQYIARVVLGRLWWDRELMELTLDLPGQTLENVWRLFQDKHYIGWGPFMAYQVVVDLRHTRYLRDAPDINSWSALGPGSRRGLNRLAGRPVGYALGQAEGLEEMLSLWRSQDEWRAPWVPHIELSDIQNCLCETDKHLRVLGGEGKPRSLYIPGRGY